MKYDFQEIKRTLLDDTTLKKFVEDNKISDEEILNNYTKFVIQKENNAVCNQCNGQSCNMDPYGLQSKIVLDNNIDIQYFKCPKIDAIDYANIDMMYFPNRDDLDSKELFFTKERAKAFSLMSDFYKNYKKGQLIKGIYFYGMFGSGKTFLMMKVAKELAKKHVKVMVAYYPDLVRYIKSTITTNELEPVINKLKYVEVLMLDDIGAETNSPFIRDEVLGPILQFRLESHLPIFMTSNYDLNLLREHFMESKDDINKVKSDRIIERIKYMMYQVALDDKNYRKDIN